ncbi:MAG: glycosyltransferase [Microbacterium sp.]|uniref:glycosyltransferase n=1 Tax=Microbacterium sp. TaxID=51671 RepID=UPI003F971CB5
MLRSASHRPVMEHADLVITHGGHGTVMKGLVAWLPLVIMPHGRDQPDNAVRIEARGAGVRISKNARPRIIAEAVSTVLKDPAYRESARRLGQRIRTEMGESTLIDELESP